ncbi:caspase b-like [Rhincodon typus]|uniref:caspase b-like n=1 Tax=Rhincodon typus TaxID=259920 RepID=UPI0009A36901|nr:caspase b-like [Rhincodon typus]
MTTRQFLLEVLDELSEDDFERFLFFLGDNVEFKPIPRGRLEGKSRQQMASLLQDFYAEEAQDICRKILNQIPKVDLVKKMFGDGNTNGSKGTPVQKKRERLEGCEFDGVLSDPLDNEIIMSKKNKMEPKILTDQKLMQLAENMGHNWQQIGIQFLGLQSYEIEQCESQHLLVVMQRFEMLKCWRNREKEGATALKLHSILANKECPISSAQFDFLQKGN